MPKSLRSILGTSNRVTKPSRSGQPRQPPPSTTSPSPSPRKGTQPQQRRRQQANEEEDELFQDKLTDLGVVKLLEEELTLRDVVQAMRYIRAHMFTPVPPTGFKSTRAAEVLNYRAATPPLVTAGHINAVLARASPTRTEREVVELVGRGVLRRVRVERRGGGGEALVEAADLEAMLFRWVSSGGDNGGGGIALARDTADAFLQFLARNPMAQTLGAGDLLSAVDDEEDEAGLLMESARTDELVRAGFLTSATHAAPGDTLRVRPEDRTTLTSIEHVSRFASGTVSAVGGQNAIHLSGGGGGGGVGGRRRMPTLPSSSSSSSTALLGPTTTTTTTTITQPGASFRVAVPGHGRYLKLAEGAVDWIREALGRTRWGEAPESWLRERFEGGGLYGTRWKEFWGVEWEWALGQAVGLGAVEVFETGSVGRGVRALGG
ncbi:hypothetical protein JDV02_007122 [Purpureocillium takamizusanense]|uniref:Serine-threonine protein kinase 19 n=1 Tax=Purpureocillium takamizusanense TaxID=2060973 RepID=A0A9Q8QLU3_9HYPO|nr:uncharacterized protein JDV02_007122 [Purpureocillium takamizusanense]UNI21104.1 hypothetical protein JDV02_007122 [Purpureocillium takamizusanense]